MSGGYAPRIEDIVDIHFQTVRIATQLQLRLAQFGPGRYTQSMSEPALITSRRNPRIVEARKLSQRKHRQRQGRFLVEGLALLEMALATGARPLEVFYSQEVSVAEDQRIRGSVLVRRLVEAGGEAIAVSLDVMQALAEREEPEGVVATFPLFERTLDQLNAQDGLALVVDRLQDPGNLGTLIRTADAVGAAAVILVEPCVDPFDPKTVRGSMGSLFNVPLVRTEDVAGLFDWLAGQGLRVVGADARRGQAWGDDLWPGGVALALGNETRGLSADVAGRVQAWTRLPIAGRAESLNVAVAGGVLMYAWLRANLSR